MPPTGGRARQELRKRLEERLPEIEEAALTRVQAISDPSEVSDPVYAVGLRNAVAAAIDFGIQATGREGADPLIPVALLGQARTAARAGIPLDTVLRRYFAGYSLLGYFVLEEAADAGIADGEELKRLNASQAGLFDRLLAAVGEEYGRETDALADATTEHCDAGRIKRLLAGEPLDTAEIAYDFDGWHLGLAATGQKVGSVISSLAKPRDCRLLSVKRDGGIVWAWLGTRSCLTASDLEHLDATPISADTRVALGEPGCGMVGWRLTHKQAIAALRVAQPWTQSVIRYSDVALLATVLNDETLATSLRQLYLAPLSSDRDGGTIACETLIAYFSAERNTTSAAASLGISRQAVNGRLQLIEKRLGKTIHSCSGELELALRVRAHDEGRIASVTLAQLDVSQGMPNSDVEDTSPKGQAAASAA